jgi:hypothetical protein
VELADVFRAAGGAYRDRHTLVPQQHRVMRAIETCRSAALGGHVEQCDQLGHRLNPAVQSNPILSVMLSHDR